VKLEVRLFRFNKEHDYLPSYPPFYHRARQSESLLDLLEHHRSKNPLFKCDFTRVYGAKVNGVAMPLATPLGEIVNQLGRDLVIEPLDTRRALHDLVIDTDDFEKPLALFAELIQESDRDFYHRYLLAYYASPMRAINPDYQGEALFMLAERLLERHPEQRGRILRTIACERGGIWHYSGLNGVLWADKESIDATIERLQLAASDYRPKGAAMVCGYEPLTTATLAGFANQRVALCLDGGPFGAVADAAFYVAALDQAGARVVGKNPFAPTGAYLPDLDPQRAYALAASVLRAAMDAGADCLCCAHQESADFLNTHRRAIARAAGQPIDIEIRTLQYSEQMAA
jgi:hypothetical protein